MMMMPLLIIAAILSTTKIEREGRGEDVERGGKVNVLCKEVYLYFIGAEF